ncbi:MAG: hypothetical protein AB8G11_03760 [Saprospiraceae bacterium]
MNKLKNFLVCFCVLLISLTQAEAQNYAEIFSETDLETIKNYEDSVDVLSGLMLHDTIAESRFISCKYMIKHLVKALKIDNSFQYKFPQFERISVQYPEDSSFRIFTWQLYVSAEEYRYFGAIQINSEALQLIPLSDRSVAIPSPQKTLTTSDKWFGAIYYNIQQVDSKEFGRYYLLYGYDANSFYVRRKLIDVLQIKEGEAYFGLPVFKIPPDILEEKKKIAEYNTTVPVGNRVQVSDAEILAKKGEGEVVSRFMVTYSAEASAILNYDKEYNLILLDNMIEAGGNYPGQGRAYVPDGSYRGFKLQEDGTWLQIEKVFNDSQETAPRPVPLDRANRLGRN